jgi:hypothetical protein
LTAGLALLLALPAVAAAASQTTWAVADFDGDRKPDLVSVTEPSASDPVIHFGSLESGAFTAASGLPTHRLRARDLDGDSDRDIVLETLASVPVAVWINDGSGHFKRGNLDEFRSQLSNGDSRFFDLTARPAPSELIDDCPRTDVVSVPGASAPDFSRTKRTRAPGESTSASRHSRIRTRGPPLL